MGSCREKIKSYDLFGHEITLNIHNEPKAHTTLVGGFFSIFVLFTFVVYTLFNIKRFLLKEGNNEVSYAVMGSFDEIGDVNFHKDSDMTMIYMLTKQDGGERPLYINNETKRHIILDFTQ